MNQADVSTVAAAWWAAPGEYASLDELEAQLTRYTTGSVQVAALDTGEIEVSEVIGLETVTFRVTPSGGRSALDVVDRGETVRARIGRKERQARAPRPTSREIQIASIQQALFLLSDTDLKDVADRTAAHRNRGGRPPR